VVCGERNYQAEGELISMCGFLDFLGRNKQKYERCSENYAKCIDEVKLLSLDLAKADEKIKQMEKVLPRPMPTDEKG